VTVRETCMTFIAQAPPAGYKAGDRTMGGSLRPAPGSYGALRAIDPRTGETKWELRHPTPSWAGVLATAGGVVFSGSNEGHIFAADSKSGVELWRYTLGAPVYGPPTSFRVEGRQLVVMPSGSTVMAFALPR
jgi:alcohol dehydrogenase (cytochrome c)